MKKFQLLTKSLLVAAGLLVGASAWAGEKTVLKYSFDDASSPAVTAGSRVSLDYTKTSVITKTVFLNAYNNTNGDPGSSTLSLGSTDLSAETWTLSFEWAAVGGCNGKVDHTTLKVGDTNLFDISGNSNWNTTVTLSIGGTATTTTLPVPGCDKSKRFSAGTGDQMNTTAYWHHFVITGSPTDGVKMTITNSNSGAAIVTDAVLSTTNVNPTSIVLEPCCGGAIGIDELSLTYYVEGEVIQTPTAAYTKVDGIKRTITAACETEGTTLYYSLDNTTWTEGASITVSESGNIYFKAVKGSSESDVLTFAAEAGTEIKLVTPTITRDVDASVTIECDQSHLLLSPTATIHYTFGSETGSFTGSKTLTVPTTETTITAYAEASGYATSETAETAVARFPLNVYATVSAPAKTSGWSAQAFSDETVTVNERTYAALKLDDVQWGNNVLLQTNGAWGLRASGNWYINSNTESSWILIQNLKKGEIVVIDASYAPNATVNATRSAFSYGTKHAYIIDADGDAEFALKKIDASTMDYFYGVYAYSENSYAIVGELTGGWPEDGGPDVVMTQTSFNTYTLVIDDFVATAGKKYEYKLRSNGAWGGYELPNSGNEEYTFENAGTYTLTFTANIEEHTLELVAEEKATYTVAGGFNTTEGGQADIIFGTSYAADLAANDMTKNADGTYSISYSDVALTTGSIKFKVVKNHDWSQAWPSSDYVINIDAAGTYDITINFNPSTKAVTATCEMQHIYTVAGDAVLFSSNWDVTDTNNDMTKNADGTYSITYTNVALTGNVEYKVVEDHAWKANGGNEWPNDNRAIVISMTGNYDVTIHFNPATGDLYETMAIYKGIGDAGYATYCASYDINFAETGVKAYIAKLTDTSVSFEEVANAKAGTGLLLKADKGSYKLKMESSSTTAEDNVLVGVLADTKVDAGSFVLLNGDKGVGFYKTANEFTVGANTAYIAKTTSARSFIGFDGETTAIENVNANLNANGEIYDLQGRRVVAPQKGLYIINGKKVVLK